MAEAKKCDRCGEFYTMGRWYDEVKEVDRGGYLRVFRSIRSDYDTRAKTYDLCPACENELMRFMSNENRYDDLLARAKESLKYAMEHLTPNSTNKRCFIDIAGKHFALERMKAGYFNLELFNEAKTDYQILVATRSENIEENVNKLAIVIADKCLDRKD